MFLFCAIRRFHRAPRDSRDSAVLGASRFARFAIRTILAPGIWDCIIRQASIWISLIEKESLRAVQSSYGEGSWQGQSARFRKDTSWSRPVTALLAARVQASTIGSFLFEVQLVYLVWLFPVVWSCWTLFPSSKEIWFNSWDSSSSMSNLIWRLEVIRLSMKVSPLFHKIVACWCFGDILYKGLGLPPRSITCLDLTLLYQGFHFIRFWNLTIKWSLLLKKQVVSGCKAPMD